ncbi:MAG TPA: hypothetical protein VFY93_16395 [Planctomycetota bacterium]|nr:hypothetical protein [Planctomycetota bacterium]
MRGTCEARIAGDVLLIAAKYTAVVQGDGAVEIPFRVEGAALEPMAALRGDALVFDTPGTHEVEAQITVKLAREGEMLRGAFRLPPAAGYTVDLALPPEVEGEVGPIVRAFRSGADGGHVVGYPDETGLFQVWMKPRSPARRLDALLGASFETVAEVSEARTGLKTSLQVSILRAPVDGIDLLLAPGQTVQALDGKNVKTWRLVRGAGEDTIEVRFTEPIQDTVTLTLETDLPRDKVETAQVPVVRVKNAVRYRGALGIVARPEVRIEGIAATGVRRLEGGQGLAHFEVWSEEARVTATLERVEARAEATTRALLAFREGGKSLQAYFGIEITGDPLFRLEPALPRGWLLRHVVLDGRDAPYTYEEDGRLVLEFPEGLKPGRHALFVALDTDEVDWVPNAGTVGFDLAGVRAGLPYEKGFLVVASDPAFRVSLGAAQGLTEVGMADAGRAFGGATDRMLFAWRFEEPGYSARFALERHEPQIAATVVMHLLPSERLLAVGASVLLDIKRTGVREIKVTLPKGTGPLVDLRGPMIKEKRAPEAGADPETWTIVFQKRIRGEYRLDLAFDRKFDADAWSAVVPEILVPDAQERGFLVIHSSGMTEIAVKREGVREADVGELPQQPERPPLEVLAYAQHPYKVEISSRRHDPEPVVQAYAESARIYGVVSPDGRVRCRAEYRIRNNDLPFLRMTLPEGAELLGALAAGEPMKPLREAGALKLPLPRSKDRDSAFIVAVVYEMRAERLGAAGELTIERPALDIEVLETKYDLHLPDGYSVTGFDGDLVPLTMREREGVLDEFLAALPPWSGGVEAAAAREPAPVTQADVDRLRAVIAEPPGDTGVDIRHFEPAYMALQTKLGEIQQGVEREASLWKAGDVSLVQQQQDTNRVLFGAALDKAAQLGYPVQTFLVDEGTLGPATPAADAGAAPSAAEAEKSVALRGTLRREFKAKTRTADEDVEAAKKLEDGVAAGEELPEEELADSDEVTSDAPFTGRAEAEPAAKPEGSSTNGAIGAGGGAGGRVGGRRFVAHGGKGPGQTKPPGGPGEGKRARPERALLSLDIEFLKSDNLCRLKSLAPTGAVTLSYARSDAYARQGYMGAVLGLAVCAVFLLGKRRRLLLLLPGALLLLLSLHFAGLSFLPSEFAMGAATALVAVTAITLGWRLALALARLVHRPWRKGAAALLLLAAAARAGDTVLVPYGTDPTKTDRVFLPADEYHRLRNLAYPETAGGATAVTDAEYEAVLLEEQLTLRARYEIAKETDDAERLPLALKDVAMTSATIDGKPAQLAVESEGYVLVLEGKGNRVLELELRPRLLGSGDLRAFSVPVRPVATARLVLKHDIPGYDAKVVELGAAEEALHRLGPVGVVAVTFAPRVEPFRAKEAELRAETATVVSVRDGFTAVASRIRYGISGGSVSRVRVRVGKDLTVLSVACPDLAGWEIDGDKNLVVALAKAADRALTVEVRAERKAERERAEAVPDVAPLDVLRDAGVVAIDTLPDLKVEVTGSRGLMRARLEDAPNDLRATADPGVVLRVERYAVRPFELSWRVYLEETRLGAETNIDLFVDRDVALAEARLRVTLERGPGPFTLSLPVPSGYEVTAVAGDLRDWWVRDGTLFLDRATRLAGTQEYRIVLRRVGATTEAFTAPALSLAGATGESGLVRLAVADGLEAEVRDVSPTLLPEDVAAAGAVPWGKLVRAFRYYKGPWRFDVFAREEPREVDAIVVSRVVPLADRVRVEALVDFHVRRGLVDGYAFVVPVAEEREALVVAHDRREVRSEGAPGGRKFIVTLRTPTRGSAAVTVSYDVPYGTEIRGVEPLGAATVTRYVAVEKAPDGEVRIAGSTNLDTADFADLPLRAPETTAQTVARVFVGAGAAFTLSLDVRRHAFETVAKAVVYSALAEAVVDRSGWTRVAMSYRVYNRSEQFLKLALPEDALLLSVVVAGEGVRPLAEGADLLVPLRKLALGSPSFDVDVAYSYPGAAVGGKVSSVKLPAVKGLDVRRTALILHVPKGFSYDFDTEMEEAAEADILAAEANDRYQEIKEMSDVAQRGSSLQAGRALSNVQQLDQEARQLLERVRETTRDAGKLQQVESQERALETLNKANRAQAEGKPQPQQAAEEAGEARGFQSWDVNEAFLGRARAEQRKQVDEFKATQQRAQRGVAQEDRSLEGTIYKGGQYRGPNGGVPPGLRSPSDAEPPPEPPQDAAAGKSVAKSYGIRFNDGADGDFRGRRENAFEGGLVADSERAGDLRGTWRDALAHVEIASAAKGRISLRIALPTDGDVYRFAQLGGAGGVRFDASEKGRGLLHGALAILFAAAAVFVLRFRAKAKLAGTGN